MQRGELLLTLILAALILAGIAYNSLRGADKTAELIITHSPSTPFDATQSLSPAPQAFNQQSIPQQTQSTVSRRLIQYLNNASIIQLEELPGIGPVLAQRIFQKRQQLGRFSEIDDILNVSGIGQSKLHSMLDGIDSIPSPQKLAPQSVPKPIYISPTPAIRSKTVKQPLLSLNQATREQLMQVSGIGEKTADTIIKARTEKGGFRSWKDVESVSGIGEKRIQQLQEFFTLQNN